METARRGGQDTHPSHVPFAVPNVTNSPTKGRQISPLSLVVTKNNFPVLPCTKIIYYIYFLIPQYSYVKHAGDIYMATQSPYYYIISVAICIENTVLYCKFCKFI